MYTQVNVLKKDMEALEEILAKNGINYTKTEYETSFEQFCHEEVAYICNGLGFEPDEATLFEMANELYECENYLDNDRSWQLVQDWMEKNQ